MHAILVIILTGLLSVLHESGNYCVACFASCWVERKSRSVSAELKWPYVCWTKHDVFNYAIVSGAPEKWCMCAGIWSKTTHSIQSYGRPYTVTHRRCLARSEANVCASTLEVLSKASLRWSAPPNDVFNFVSYVRLTVYITNLLFQALFYWHSSTDRVYHTVFLRTIVLGAFVMALMPCKWEERRCPPCTVTVGVVRRCKMYLAGPVVRCLYRREDFFNRSRKAAHACFPCLLHAWDEHFFPKEAHSVRIDISNYSNVDCERIVLKSRNKCFPLTSVLPECILKEIRTGVSFVDFVVVMRKFHQNRVETVLTCD